jgi:hypothetical protein
MAARLPAGAGALQPLPTASATSATAAAAANADGLTPELKKRIAEEREREATLAAARKRKKKAEDEKEFAAVIEECRANKNRRKLLVTLERVLADEEIELDEESPLVVKAKLLIEDLTAHFELVEELQKRERAVEELSKRERGEIARVGGCPSCMHACSGTALLIIRAPSVLLAF